MTVTPLGRDQDCSLKNQEPDVPAPWFLDPGGWSKTATVSLYFIFPGICTLSLVDTFKMSCVDGPMCACMSIPWPAYIGQRRTCENHFSPYNHATFMFIDHVCKPFRGLFHLNLFYCESITLNYSITGTEIAALAAGSATLTFQHGGTVFTISSGGAILMADSDSVKQQVYASISSM
ncbi:hypothetical protein STEG23_034568 [Scotinomys teguina]